MFCSPAQKGEKMDCKYEIAKKILEGFKITPTKALSQFENEKDFTKKADKAIDWYLEHYKKTLKAMSEGEK